MILNNNCLPWPLTAVLKAIVHSHISDCHTASVICFDDKFGEAAPVEIAVDVDGSMVHLVTPEGISLGDNHEQLMEWDVGFVANYRAGRYKAAVFPLLELDERVQA